MKHLFALAALAAVASPALAQAPTAAPAAKASTAKPARAPVVRTAKSLAGAQQADAKGLQGQTSCKKA